MLNPKAGGRKMVSAKLTEKMQMTFRSTSGKAVNMQLMELVLVELESKTASLESAASVNGL